MYNYNRGDRGHYVGNPQKKSTKYEHIIPMLYSIEENEDIKGVLIILNTVGGDVEAGLAMAELINSISKSCNFSFRWKS